MKDIQERATRIIEAAQKLHEAATALEREDWFTLNRLCQAAAREARVLLLMQQREDKENGQDQKTQ